jgi:hypothetical protein
VSTQICAVLTYAKTLLINSGGRSEMSGEVVASMVGVEVDGRDRFAAVLRREVGEAGEMLMREVIKLAHCSL